MLIKDGIEFRNLVEQVQKNKEDIANHYAIDRTLSNFGIKIVGTVATVNDLPDPVYYEGAYGDGYAVGQAGSYTYYIFTRPDPNAGIYENHWLDVGQLAIQGPQGPVGPQGPRGETGQSTKWFTNQLAADENTQPGDLLLERNGDVFQYNGDLSQWVLITNIKGAQGVQGPRGLQGEQGPQGIQGEKGDTGDVGGFISIRGIFANSSQLPLPSQIKNLTTAYLVGTVEPYTLWIQVGENSDTAIWEDMGPFNVATAVTVGGQYRSTWNADTKLDLIEPVSKQTDLVAIVKDYDGFHQENLLATYTPKTSHKFSGVLRGMEGQILGQTPPLDKQTDLDLINRGELTEKLSDGLSGKVDKVDPTTLKGRMSAYAVNPYDANRKVLAIEDTPQCRTGNIVTYRYQSEAATTEPVGGGVLITSTPTKPYHCANQLYVDAQKVRKHLVEFKRGEGAPSMYIAVYSTNTTPFTSIDELPDNITFMAFNSGDEYVLLFLKQGTSITECYVTGAPLIRFFHKNTTDYILVSDTVTEL